VCVYLDMASSRVKNGTDGTGISTFVRFV